MTVVKRIKGILRDYCENTSLVGFGYIANRSIHLSERIFWLICIILTTGGSYHLVREYQKAFERNAISLVIEDTSIRDKTNFISIGMCEIGNEFESYPTLHKFLKQFDNETENKNDDIEQFVFHMIFMNTYFYGAMEYCDQRLDCSDCVQCPLSGYKEIAEMALSNCSELIAYCSWNGVQFPCCDYFLPLATSVGKCYVINSLHTTTKHSSNWLNSEIDWDAGDGEMVLKLKRPVNLYLLNEEDVPSHLQSLNVFGILKHLNTDLRIYVREIINDQDVRDISPKHRKCRFPEEKFKDSAYDFYSFQTCVVDCMKRVTFERCGCNIFKMLIKSDDKIPPCDYYGYRCLEKNQLILPSQNILQPWNSFGINCECLPSCTENEIDLISKFQDVPIKALDNGSYQVTIKQPVSSDRFRRQAVRSHMDVVVTIGGILGLFMGASVLSGIEILYFFIIRIFNSSK